MPCCKIVLCCILVLAIEAIAAENCYFGPLCQLPCRCESETSENDCDPRTGQCLSGQCGASQMYYLDSREPTPLKWSGPGCQIGNVALHKPASQVKTFGQFGPGGAVDGQIGTHMKSAHPDSHDPSVPAWWMVDLEALHILYNVTLYNTFYGWGHPDIMSDFTIKVGNTNDVHQHVPCAVHKDAVKVGQSVTLECKAKARFVSYHRNPGSFAQSVALLPEVIIIGQLYNDFKTDCSRCEETCTSPSDYCGKCIVPFLPPNCMDSCPKETYLNGSVCLPCGKCIKGMSCDYRNGICPDGCAPWFTPRRKCNVQIKPYTIPGELILINAEADSLLITFQKANIPSNIEQYYYYRISHKKVGEKEAAVESYVTVAHVAKKKQIELPGLTFNTNYVVYLTLVRQLNNENEDIDVKSITVETSCKAPEKPIISLKQTGMMVEISYKLKPDGHGCGRHTAAFLYYKDKTQVTWMKRIPVKTDEINGKTTMTLRPGEFLQFKLRIFNDADLDSMSEVIEAGITEQRALAMRSGKYGSGYPFNLSLGMMIGIGAGTLVLIAVVVLVATFACKPSRSAPPSGNRQAAMEQQIFTLDSAPGKDGVERGSTGHF